MTDPSPADPANPPAPSDPAARPPLDPASSPAPSDPASSPAPSDPASSPAPSDPASSPALAPGDPAMRFPLQEFLDFDIARGDGRGEAHIAQLGEHHFQPHGAVHGAVLFAILDTAMGAATVTVLDEGKICATTDLQIRYLRPVFGGSLTATARVVSAGKRMVTLTGEVTDGDGRIVATGTAAFAVLGG